MTAHVAGGDVRGPASTIAPRWLERAWAAAPRTFAVAHDGVALACRGWNLAATHLPGLILAHGYRAHARWWDHIAPWLADTHRVVAFDFSGMGDSGRREVYRRADHGREALAVAHAAGIDRPVIAAHSYGAVACAAMCHDLHRHVARFVILDSAIGAGAGRAFSVPPAPVAIRSYPDQAAATAAFRLTPAGPSVDPAILAYVAAHSVVEDAGAGWTWKFDPAMPDTLNADEAAAGWMSSPVAADMIFGEDSPFCGPDRRRQVAAALPRLGRAIGIPGASHHLMIEAPAALIAALRAVLGAPGLR